MHEPATAATSAVSSVTAVAAQKTLRPDGCFQHEISDCPRCPRHGSAKCPPLLRPRRERAGSKARKPAAHPCGEARVRAGQHIVIHGQRCQPAQQQREPKPGRAGRRRTREHRQPFLFRIQKNTPCRTYASQHIPAGGESFRKQLYTSGPFGSSCFGSSFFVSFAFCLAASCAPALPWQPVPRRGRSWKWPTWRPGCGTSDLRWSRRSRCRP